jgi:hypothetical protein
MINSKNYNLILSGIPSLASRGAEIMVSGAGDLISGTAATLLSHPLLWGSALLGVAVLVAKPARHVVSRAVVGASAYLARGYAAHNYRTNNLLDVIDMNSPVEGDPDEYQCVDEGVKEHAGTGRDLVVYDAAFARRQLNLQTARLRDRFQTLTDSKPQPVRVVVVGPCVRLAKRCGMEVRAKMGNPTRTRANIMLATQRCAAWIGENAASLRKRYYQDCLAKAVLFTLTPSVREVELARQLNDPALADRERYCTTSHTIPMFSGRVGEWLSMVPMFRVPAMPNF